ncbi:lipopolysaccharide biosynthesis protein [Arthrobacter rhizosphaerae]|uniref:lipopolysaccharide biosynthesis protein n=1 Tax=Arthrobacter rhizosphaerae TaxID=2855490 RepID=UPI001FF3C594|nr:polysaccharide biosynthesis protein [Arthrobacter rhizosphaerae]
MTKAIVMGVSGLLGIITSQLIISRFGIDVYAQYGLLASLPSLLPFADLGIAAVVINAVAGSSSPRSDEYVRRAILTALRVLFVSGFIFIIISVAIYAFGWWPGLLGNGLIPGDGPLAACACLVLFALALPLSIGQRILVGMERTNTQVMSQIVVAPFILFAVLIVVGTAAPAGSFLAIFSYIANALNSLICLIIAGKIISPQLKLAVRAVPRIKRFPGVKISHLAWPMLLQMVALPIAMQTHRLLLSHLTAGDELAQYNLGSQLYGIVIQTVAAAGIAFWPIYAKARSASRVESPLAPTLWFAGGGLALGGVLAALSPLIVEFVSGGRFQLDGWLIGGFVVFVGLQAAKYPVGMYMTDHIGLRFQTIPIFIMVPMNLALSWWFIGLVGAGGPIIASAISVALCQLAPNIWYVKRDLAKRRAEAGAVSEKV